MNHQVFIPFYRPASALDNRHSIYRHTTIASSPFPTVVCNQISSILKIDWHVKNFADFNTLLAVQPILSGASIQRVSPLLSLSSLPSSPLSSSIPSYPLVSSLNCPIPSPPLSSFIPTSSSPLSSSRIPVLRIQKDICPYQVIQGRASDSHVT